MANRFLNPRPQFFTSTPATYSGGSLNFYASGTSTPLAVYSDSALTTSLGSELTLNSAGYYNGEIFLAESAYKVVLENSAGSVIWTADPVSSSDFSANAQFLTYAGNPNGSVAGTAGTGTIQSDVIWDRTNNILYIATTTGSASTTVWTAVNASASTPAVPMPQGRLTPTSATPVISGDVASATTIYYALYNGNLVPIYNGTSMVPTEFTELSLSLVSSHADGIIYDVFVFSNSGVLTLVTGPAWTTSTAGSGARGSGAGTTALARVKGLWTNSVSMTGRNGSTTYAVAANRGTYLGTISIDVGVTGQCSCTGNYGQNRKYGVWNAYNRVPIVMVAGDGTASWTYNTNTIRQSNGASGNKITTLTGLAEETIVSTFSQLIAGTTADANPNVLWQIGIGLNSATAFAGRIGQRGTTGFESTSTDSGRIADVANASHTLTPTLGINNINCLEKTVTAGNSNTTYSGGSDNMELRTMYRG